MSFSDHKITQFTHRISELADQPNLPADELKARFDSSPEELRKSLNAVCDDADSLENRVDSIITQTFEGVVDKSMLAESLAAELDAKATQTALSAEQTAREDADSSLGSREQHNYPHRPDCTKMSDLFWYLHRQRSGQSYSQPWFSSKGGFRAQRGILHVLECIHFRRAGSGRRPGTDR